MKCHVTFSRTVQVYGTVEMTADTPEELAAAITQLLADDGEDAPIELADDGEDAPIELADDGEDAPIEKIAWDTADAYRVSWACDDTGNRYYLAGTEAEILAILKETTMFDDNGAQVQPDLIIPAIELS